MIMCKDRLRLEAIGDGVVPEAVEALHELVQDLEFVLPDASDLGDRGHVAVVESGDGTGDFRAFLGERDTDRTAVDARALVIDVAQIDQFLEIVGNVRAEIIATVGPERSAMVTGCIFEQLLISVTVIV